MKVSFTHTRVHLEYTYIFTIYINDTKEKLKNIFLKKKTCHYLTGLSKNECNVEWNTN